MADLFASNELTDNAPRPLADRLRPKVLDDVVGQGHLVGGEGTLSRMLRSGSLGSLVFGGRLAPARRPLLACLLMKLIWLSTKYPRFSQALQN